MALRTPDTFRTTCLFLIKHFKCLVRALKPSCAEGGMVNIARDLLDQSLRQRPPINSLWFLGFSQRAKTARAETNAAPEEEERTPRIEGRRRWIVTRPCCGAAR